MYLQMVALWILNYLSYTGLLSEGTSIGDVNWARVTKSLPRSTSEQSQEPHDAGSLLDARGPEDSDEVLDDAVQEKEEESNATIIANDFSSIYNCVLYGLPHITLTASPS